MSNIKDMHVLIQDCNDLVLVGWPPCYATSSFFRRRPWAHAPVIHAASHFYHDKRDAWVSISMHICDLVPIAEGLRLAALRAAGAQLLFGFRGNFFEGNGE